MTDWGALASQRLEQLAQISEPAKDPESAKPGKQGVTRLPFTSEHRRALELLRDWMGEAGLAVRLDDAGTLIGRQPGPQGAATLLLGSHQDSVRNGGAFDGIMGVILPLLALGKLASQGAELPFAVEILAFADEEGVRFPTALMGPRALAGSFEPATLDMQDNQGQSLAQAMREFGLDPAAIAGLKRDPGDILGYVETHIEQGPVLEQTGQALGIVTAICGIERHQVSLIGETGHAGTLPMAGRRDALVGAAAIISEVNRLACASEELRGTVGALHLWPGAVNAVPKQVNFTIELRAPDDAERESAGRTLSTFAQDIARQHGLELRMERSYQQTAQACDPALTGQLVKAVQAAGNQGLRLPSGATHDASAMADLCPISMLFVRCKGGVSHAPEEEATSADMGAAIDALCHFLSHFSHGSSTKAASHL